jgi:hypothetical protein
VTKVHRIRLSKIVLDFVQDETRTNYLVGIPAFEIDNVSKILEIGTPPIAYDEFKPKLTASEVLEDKSALVFWKLWKIAFLKKDVSKIVTMKMISELRGHYNKRGIFKFDHFTKFKDTKRTWKVWELCYMIVLAEHELMKTELQFAVYQGIPVDEENEIK